MHRSNPIGLAFGILFFAAMGVGYLWSHSFPRKVQVWSAEAWIAGITLAGFFLWWHGMRLAC